MRKISTHELRPGMKVLDLDMPWLLHLMVYTTEGVIESPEQIAKIIADGFTEAFIDDGEEDGGEKSPDTDKERLDKILTSPEQVPVQFGTPPGLDPKVAIEEELPVAKGAYEDSMRFAKRTLLAVTRPNGEVSLNEAEDIIDGMLGSVSRNHNAFLGIIKLRARDEYTYTHSVNVAALATLFARHLGFSADAARRIGVAGLLHDLGKSFVPDEILHSPKRLTEEQFTIMKQHPELGYRQVRNIEGLYPEVAQGILEHHERFDGRGYPRGLKGDQISMVGRILGIVDTYDAMTSSRVFKDPMLPHKAVALIYSMRGESFQTEILEQFIRCQGVYPVGSVVELASGWRGVVVETNGAKPLAPKVVLLQDPTGRGIYGRILDLAAPDAGDNIKRVLSASEAGINPAMALSLR